MPLVSRKFPSQRMRLIVCVRRLRPQGIDKASGTVPLVSRKSPSQRMSVRRLKPPGIDKASGTVPVALRKSPSQPISQNVPVRLKEAPHKIVRKTVTLRKSRNPDIDKASGTVPLVLRKSCFCLPQSVLGQKRSEAVKSQTSAR